MNDVLFSYEENEWFPVRTVNFSVRIITANPSFISYYIFKKVWKAKWHNQATLITLGNCCFYVWNKFCIHLPHVKGLLKCFEVDPVWDFHTLVVRLDVLHLVLKIPAFLLGGTNQQHSPYVLITSQIWEHTTPSKT